SDMASKLGVKQGEGVLVEEVRPNTPASEAKLQDGDVITKFAGHETHSPHELQDWVERSPVNTSSAMDIVRDGKHMTLNVTVKAMPSNFGREDQIQDEEEHAEKPKDNSTYSADSLGLEVSDMNADEAAAYKGFEGVLVRKVEPETSAWEKGLRPGMLIRKVG